MTSSVTARYKLQLTVIAIYLFNILFVLFVSFVSFVPFVPY